MSPILRLSDSSIIQQPTLVIGAGGTGNLAVRNTKKAIIDLVGKVPPWIRFLSLDVDQQEEDPAPKLDATEYLNLAEDPQFQLASVLRDFADFPKFHPELAWLAGTRMDSAIVKDGCQGMSRLGRAVFFEAESRIQQTVKARFRELNNSTLEADDFPPSGQFAMATVRAPVVHLIVSLAGGMGTGCVIDLAYGVRQWANDVFGRHADVIAHLVLPEAFSDNSERIRDKKRAVAATMLEQIEYLSDSRRPSHPVRYRNGQVRMFAKAVAPFDLCFVLSGLGPNGGDQRRTLCTSIGRMIRAMTVEPASQAIFSDANNKQHDILASFDPANMRRLFLASYGLHSGKWGFTRHPKIVRSWICKSLGSLIDPVPVPEGWTARIDQMLAEASNPGRLAGELPRPKGFQVRGLLDETTPYDQAIAAALDLFFADLTGERARHVKQYLSQRVVRTVVSEMVKMVDEALRDHATRPALVHATLAQWVERITTTKEKNRATAELSPASVAANLREACDQALRARAQDPTRATAILAPIEIQEEVNRLLVERSGQIDLACLRHQTGPMFEHLIALLKNWVGALKDLAKTASEEIGRLGNGPDQDAAGIDPLSTPVGELTHPDRSDAEATQVQRERFYQQFVHPILADLFNPLRRGDEPFGPGDDRSALVKAGEFLKDGLQRRHDEMLGFLDDYSNDSADLFRKPVDPQNAVEHPFTKAIAKVVDKSVPKVRINQANRYSETLDMTIAQCGPGTCVPGLLTRKMGSDYREVLVSRGYEERTNEPLVIGRFKYGFCVEALDGWEGYLESRKRHLDGMQLRAEDLFLDADLKRGHDELLTSCLDRPHAGSNGRAHDGKDGANDEPRHADLDRAWKRFRDHIMGELGSWEIGRSELMNLIFRLNDLDERGRSILEAMRAGRLLGGDETCKRCTSWLDDVRGLLDELKDLDLGRWNQAEPSFQKLKNTWLVLEVVG